MKAVIMAGGEGTRLRPMTCGRPKPMMPVAGKPVMEHIVRLLKKNGFDEIVATLMYRPTDIQETFGDGAAHGVRIEYSIERVPLGTAGSVGLCRDMLGNEPFLVISGDCMCDFDLSEVAKTHRVRGADATIVVCGSSNPQEYGLVLTDGAGRVTGFLEKPAWNQVFSNLINTPGFT